MLTLPFPLFWWPWPHAQAVCHLFWVLVIGFSSCSCCWLRCHEGIKPPLNQGQGSLFIWVGVFCIQEVDASLSLFFDMEGYFPITPPMFGLANCDLVPWVVILISRFTIQWLLQAAMSFPWPNTCVPSDIYSHITLPVVFIHPWWMLQWTSMVEVVTSHWSTPGKSCW